MKVFILYHCNPGAISVTWKNHMQVAEAIKPGGHMCSVYTTLELAKAAASERNQEHLDKIWRDKFEAGGLESMDQHMAERPIVSPTWEKTVGSLAMDPMAGHSAQTQCWAFCDENTDSQYSIREEELRGVELPS